MNFNEVGIAIFSVLLVNIVFLGLAIAAQWRTSHTAQIQRENGQRLKQLVQQMEQALLKDSVAGGQASHELRIGQQLGAIMRRLNEMDEPQVLTQPTNADSQLAQTKAELSQCQSKLATSQRRVATAESTILELAEQLNQMQQDACAGEPTQPALSTHEDLLIENAELQLQIQALQQQLQTHMAPTPQLRARSEPDLRSLSPRLA